MSNVKAGLRILTDTEAQLRRLIAQALGEGRYGEVADLARIADGLAHLVATNAVEVARRPETGDLPVREIGPVGPAAARPRRAGAGRAKSLPRFERDRARLVKIAWSKRDQAEYEHRAPRHIVDALIEAIRAKRGEGAQFDTGAILPLWDSATQREVPSYQAYLALAWLRHEGIVIKEGRDRYSLKPMVATRERLAELWEALPPHDPN